MAWTRASSLHLLGQQKLPSGGCTETGRQQACRGSWGIGVLLIERAVWSLGSAGTLGWWQAQGVNRGIGNQVVGRVLWGLGCSVHVGRATLSDHQSRLQA